MAQQQQELQDVKQQHASKLAELKSQQAGAEASATSLLQQAQARLSSTSVLNGAELAAVQDKAAAAVEVEAAAEAAGKKAELLKAALQKVDDEVGLMTQNSSSSDDHHLCSKHVDAAVFACAAAHECMSYFCQWQGTLLLLALYGLPALPQAEEQRKISPSDTLFCTADHHWHSPLQLSMDSARTWCVYVCAVCAAQVATEVESYKSSRRAAVLEELVGQLESDAAVSAQRLEQQTAELQQVEAAVADKAAVLQKLSEQVDAKQVRHNVANLS
jgi:hypothetical protein